jgi:diguanylate cyclase (GGDEF)-like protein/PAS domain S-box-containing protein
LYGHGGAVRGCVIDNFESMSQPDALRELHRLIIGVHAHRELRGTVQAVAEVVVSAVGFGVAAVSVVRPNGGVKTIAVAGNEEARDELIGVQRPLSEYEEEFAVAEEWGLLRFVPHERAPDAHSLGWIPPLDVSPDENAWHPLDALFAPLRSSTGELIGILSVDLPFDGRLPSPGQRNLLEVLAVEAGIAIDNALLTERLRAGEEIFRQAFDGTAGGMALLGVHGDEAGRFLRVNPGFCRIVGYTSDGLLSISPADLTHADDRPIDEPLMAALIAGDSQMYRRDKRLLHRSGSPVWVTVTATIARADDGSPLCAILQIEDISRRRAELEELHHQARHDPLTNLPNRTLVFERLQKSIAIAEREQKPGVVFFLDVDDFKIINDQHGHLVGDQVLAMLGQRIRSAVREHDLVGRFGGDEFVVIADRLEGGAAQVLADRIATAVSAPITNRGVAVNVGITIGICQIPQQGGDPAQILWDADRAMYEHKRKRPGFEQVSVQREGVGVPPLGQA